MTSNLAIYPQVGARVYFRSFTNLRSGVVTGIVQDITNGRKHAWVNVDHDLTGIFHCVPVDELVANIRDITRALITDPSLARTLEKKNIHFATGEGMNFVFISGHADPFPSIDNNNRRYFVLKNSDQKIVDAVIAENKVTPAEVPALIKTLLERIEK